MTSAQRKLARGVEHSQLLCDEAGAFENSNAYVLRTEEEARPPEHIHYTCFAVKQRDAPDHWPLLAGDAIQNLRSALEHATWAARVNRKGRVQFPIFRDKCEFQVKGRPMIASLEPSIRALIEECQPCNTLPQWPEQDPLWKLSLLSNRDKHRTLSTVATSLDMTYVGWDGDPADHFEFTYVGFGKPLTDEDTKVVSFLATKDVKVKPEIIYQVTIEGYPLRNVFLEIMRRVALVVRMIETGEPYYFGVPYVAS